MGWCSNMAEDAARRPLRIGVAMKWVALRPEVDALTAAVSTDDRWSGASPSDLAALEFGLRLAEESGGSVTVATVGGDSSTSLLVDAIACGANRAIRIDPRLLDGEQPTSREVGAALARVFVDADLVVCGDWSLDRGSASVPVFMATALGIDAVCGVVRLDTERAHGDGPVLIAERRLDGGRRERLAVSTPAVVTVEGTVARIRRATLAGLLASQRATIEVIPETLRADETGWRLERTLPYRPPARVLDAPRADESPLQRVAQLMGVNTARTPPARLELDAEAAAQLIIERVRQFDES